ncbi:MAG: PAS domain-containing protein [Candidatus Eisenbacteria bacterium]|uniref:histidine kinase n=1 Tax=Eiseniibacteriota bacterium TaxID=2212470 RepID=A0A948RVB6_UNCEI|nr:PAS domain-containing protein [Candidatus Eisenbacteria bacterium]MBU1947493.1 PAS domain-containing protein [Candidatus Eisenbacteria bacterium]MBU2691683.1 PAS domain-containing protein [Candidatus Eisenbacteria bacterium]
MGFPQREFNEGIAPEKSWRAAYESIQALHPSLPALDEDPLRPMEWEELVGNLLKALERAHRSLIQRETQLAGLRDHTDSLLMTSDDRTLARLSVQYLQKGYGFPEVLLALEELDTRDVRAYWSMEDGPFPKQGEILWSIEEIHGSLLSEILQGKRLPEKTTCEAVSRTALPHPSRITPAYYDILIPLPSRRRLGASQVGLLAVRLNGDEEEHSGLHLELEGIAYSLAASLENHRLQRDIMKAQRLREDLLRSLGHALIAVDRDGRVIAFNKAAVHWFGVDAGDVIGSSMDNLPESLRPMTRRLDSVITREKDQLSWEGDIKPAGGPPRPVSISANLLRDESGRPYGAVAVAADLSDVKTMEKQIRQLDRLAAVGRFTTAIAHEIKNPLTGIATGVEYLRRSFAEDASEQKDIQFISNEIQRLNRIIQDLFNLSHPRELIIEKVNPTQLVEESIKSIRADFEEKHVKIETHFDKKCRSVNADADRMRQVLINLLKNAAEASSEGQIVSVKTRLAGTQQVEIEVRDQGSGLTPEQSERLFEPFFTTKPGGTGLGLYICHGIVQHHGGRMVVESQPGEGSTFHVYLPAAGPR